MNPSISTDIKFTVNNDRVLVPVGQPCPFGCKYCYTRGGEVGPMNFEAEEILDALTEFAATNDFSTVQLGYDGDPFARPDRGIMMIRQLAKLGKNVNFSTKALVRDAEISALAEIQKTLVAARRTLSAIVSLSCWESAPSIEPSTPSPAERLAAIAKLVSNNIPTFIAVRPILPHVPDQEYERIIFEGVSVRCSGFILGPLYADSENKFVRFIPVEKLLNVPSKKVRVSWAPHSPIWHRYESRPRLERLSAIIRENGGLVFESSVDAIMSPDLEGMR